jgi:Fe-S oxidoreductase
LLLDDCFTTFNEPEIGRAAVRVLEQAGYSVVLAGLTCCGRPLISKGLLREARTLVQREIGPLARRLENGTPLLGLEPSCALTLADEWPELLPNSETKQVAAAIDLAEDWLAKEVQAGRCQLAFTPKHERCVLHGHCHQKALRGMQDTAAALHLVPGLNVSVLDTACCGMAGSFGFEKEHYDLSVAIANLSVLPALAEQPGAIVVASGTSCRHQIKDLTGRQAYHPLEVLEECLPGSP